MTNTIESDAKVDALETRDFVPSQNDLVDSIPPAMLDESYRQPANVGLDLWQIFSR